MNFGISSLDDITGVQFNDLTPIRHIGVTKNNRQLWLCRCKCGETCIVRANHLISGNTKSCGCRRNGNPKHNLRKTLIYDIWIQMKERCYNPNNKRYKNYGGRGIKVCDRWLHNPKDFVQDMGERPNGMSLDRINNDGDYTLENCRWATPLVQAQNSRRVTHRKYLLSQEAHNRLYKNFGIKGY